MLFYCTWFKIFIFFLPLLLELTQPMFYILKRFGGSEMGVLHLKNHPLKRNQVRLEPENGNAICLRHWTHCQSVVSIDYLIKI